MQDPIMASIRQSSDYVVREDGISLRIGEARSISHSWLSLAQCGECSLIRNPEQWWEKRRRDHDVISLKAALFKSEITITTYKESTFRPQPFHRNPESVFLSFLPYSSSFSAFPKWMCVYIRRTASVSLRYKSASAGDELFRWRSKCVVVTGTNVRWHTQSPLK